MIGMRIFMIEEGGMDNRKKAQNRAERSQSCNGKLGYLHESHSGRIEGIASENYH